jgi:putative transcriptional regulator
MNNATSKNTEDYLSGKLLIAMPGIGDPRFERSVVYLCAHNEKGAMGLIINKPAGDLSYANLIEQVMGEAGELDARNLSALENLPVLLGGPVETSRGFILHSDDYKSDEAMLSVNTGFCVTASIDILRAIAAGRGPRRSLMALGYAGWGPGQLEHEIRANGWLSGTADRDVVLDAKLDTKWKRALAALGVSAAMLSSEGGQA